MTDEDKPPSGFERYRRRAEKMLGSPERLTQLVGNAARKLAATGGDRVDRVRDDVRTLIDLIRCWANGEYRDVSRSSIATIVGAVLYFLVPFDLIPDFLLGIGFIDDVSVIGYVLSVLRTEIDAFKDWRSGARADHLDGPPEEDPDEEDP